MAEWPDFWGFQERSKKGKEGWDIWARKQPQGYTAENENRLLLAFERAGEVLTTVCALIFEDTNLRPWSN